MARYIDAEKYPCKGCPIEYCYENCKKFYAWLEGCDYDVEAKVAELEKKSEEYNEKADRHTVYEDYFTRYYSIANGIDIAISIVRGKERKGCANCKHQPEPLTTCEWMKSQTVVFKECPRWDGKE